MSLSSKWQFSMGAVLVLYAGNVLPAYLGLHLSGFCHFEARDSGCFAGTREAAPELRPGLRSTKAGTVLDHVRSLAYHKLIQRLQM